MTLAKQFDFRITGRGVLTDPTLPATPANITYTVDTVTVDGTDYPAASINATSITNIETNVETAIQGAYHTQQTITIGSTSVANGQTVILTSGVHTVTYTNTSGVAVADTAGALATALKTACDANADWAARFNTAVSGNNLVVTQIGDHTKVALIVITGTATVAATVA